jgi:uncharacterized membrane protein
VFPLAYWLSILTKRLPQEPTATNGMPTVLSQFGVGTIAGAIVGLIYLFPLLAITHGLKKTQPVLLAEISAIASVVFAIALIPLGQWDAPLLVLIACSLGIGAYAAGELAL